MGREAKILLGLLGLLAGVFCGVLSMKLFVHRPPAGAGPDVRIAAETEDARGPVVSAWPSLPAAAFAAAPPLGGEPASAAWSTAAEADRIEAVVAEGGAASRFDPAMPPALDPGSRFSGGGQDADSAREDPFVNRVAYEEPASPALEPVPTAGARLPASTAAFEEARPVGAAAAPAAVAGGYDVQPGDSWWQIAERAYGDGRLYRALFAWNRAIDPRVTLVPGTRLEIPPVDRLAAAWPRLVPR